MIIAEIAQNFQNLDEAKELTRLAKENGADLVKAQLFDSLKLYGKHVPAELTFEQAQELFDYGASIGIEVFYSVFDVERIEWCEKIGVKRYKIACSQNSNLPLLDAVGITGKPTIISYQDGANHTWLRLSPHKGLCADIQLLYCVPNYPTELGDIDFGENFDSEWSWAKGFSDHAIGLDASKIALARGAGIIEKHMCFSHLYGVDAEWGMTPQELRELKDWEIKVSQIL